MVLIGVHLNAGHSDGDSVAIGIYTLPLPPPPYPLAPIPNKPYGFRLWTLSTKFTYFTAIPPYPLLPVPNKPYGFCGR